MLILTEGSADIGHGHITRCLSLYQAFELVGCEPHFLVAGDNSVEPLLRETRYKLFDWHNRWKEVREKLKDFQAVVIDSYIADINIYEDLSALVKTKLYIDDYKRLEYPPGIVLNGGVYAEELNYPMCSEVKYILGPKYIPLRNAFWKVKSKNIRKEMRKVLITFGGDDSRNMTPKVIRLLRENFKNLELFVVVGKGFRNKGEVLELMDEKVNIFENVSAEGMKDLMLKVDIAISAGGQTTYELARVGTPAILVAVAENQLLNCKSWEKKGFAMYAGWWQENRIFENILKGLESLKSQAKRKDMSKIGKSLVDGKGALRVAKMLLKD